MQELAQARRASDEALDALRAKHRAELEALSSDAASQKGAVEAALRSELEAVKAAAERAAREAEERHAREMQVIVHGLPGPRCGDIDGGGVGVWLQMWPRVGLDSVHLQPWPAGVRLSRQTSDSSLPHPCPPTPALGRVRPGFGGAEGG